jgi:DNA-binding HxlR family transcriptional regulator
VLGRTYDNQVCSIARALELVGERWTLLIIRDALFAGVTRFSDHQHNLGIATNVLTARLDALVEADLLERRRTPNGQPEYVLTDKGRGLEPALIALTQWGDQWTAPDKPPIRYRHGDCTEDVRVETTCAVHGRVDPSDVKAQPGPGMPAAYLANRRPHRVR